MTFVAYHPRNGVLDVATTDTDLRADYAASIALGQVHVVDIDTADVAELANLAQADKPALMDLGTGYLGAGTNPAQPYLQAMLGMRGVTERNVSDIRMGYDSADEIIIRFLGNVKTWRGDTARLVKARLRAMIA